MDLDPYPAYGINTQTEIKWAVEEKGRVEERFLREHECQFIAFDETLVDSINFLISKVRTKKKNRSNKMV